MKTKAPFLSLRSIALLVLAAIALAVTGCTQVLVTPEMRGEYRLGELQVMFDRDFAAVHVAAKNGIKDFGLFETRDDRKVIEAELNARDSTDTRVVVKVKELGANRTSLKIRYGVKGDLPSSQKLYAAIAKRL